ncbi:MAG TPA: hypothetical protein D7H74_01980 [Candidatus Poseidoniales archaeon]|nr:MAG TPA: hypothetical protein D7H74_01980 [Candidatus Poseidoniales archaeon]
MSPGDSSLFGETCTISSVGSSESISKTIGRSKYLGSSSGVSSTTLRYTVWFPNSTWLVRVMVTKTSVSSPGARETLGTAFPESSSILNCHCP